MIIEYKENEPESYVFLIPTHFPDLEEWAGVFNKFAKLMPVIRKNDVITEMSRAYGFVIEQINILPKNHFLKLAKCDEDREFINELYKCSS